MRVRPRQFERYYHLLQMILLHVRNQCYNYLLVLSCTLDLPISFVIHFSQTLKYSFCVSLVSSFRCSVTYIARFTVRVMTCILSITLTVTVMSKHLSDSNLHTHPNPNPNPNPNPFPNPNPSVKHLLPLAFSLTYTLLANEIPYAYFTLPNLTKPFPNKH